MLNHPLTEFVVYLYFISFAFSFDLNILSSSVAKAYNCKLELFESFCVKLYSAPLTVRTKKLCLIDPREADLEWVLPVRSDHLSQDERLMSVRLDRMLCSRFRPLTICFKNCKHGSFATFDQNFPCTTNWGAAGGLNFHASWSFFLCRSKKITAISGNQCVWLSPCDESISCGQERFSIESVSNLWMYCSSRSTGEQRYPSLETPSK